jgi:hypothetical protein
MRRLTLPIALPLAIYFSAVSPSTAQGTPQPETIQTQVMKVDDAYRLAKLGRNTAALDRILADGFYETNQNGNTRDKADTIDLWRTFSITSLTTDSFEVRTAGDRAIVTGTQTEDGAERMLFTRIYSRGSDGWKLLSSTQFRNPAADQPNAMEDQVMKADEAYRLAKLRRDTAGLDRILAAGFYETNQNGNSRDKAQTIDLWRTFTIASLSTDTFQVHVTGETAMVFGAQTENGSEHMLFTRIYVNTPAGWQLLSSTQFRNPKLAPTF